MSKEQNPTNTPTIDKLRGMTIPLTAKEYSAETLLSLVFAAKDLESGVSARIFQKTEELRTLISDEPYAKVISGCLRILDDIAALTGNHTREPVSGEPPPSKAEEPKVDKFDGQVQLWEGDDKPGGKPGIQLVLNVISYLRRDKESMAQTLESLQTGRENKKTKSPQLKKSTREFIAVAFRIVGDTVADWIFNAAKEDGILSVTDLHSAVFHGKADGLIAALSTWGLEPDEGVVERSNAWKKAKEDKDIWPIVNKKTVAARSKTSSVKHNQEKTKAPAVEPEKTSTKTAGSAASVMKALRQAYDCISDATKEKLAEHLRTNMTDRQAALAPILKLLSRKEEWSLASHIIAELHIDKLRGSVDDFYTIFAHDDWGRLYKVLCLNLVTKGPTPPWVDENA